MATPDKKLGPSKSLLNGSAGHDQEAPDFLDMESPEGALPPEVEAERARQLRMGQHAGHELRTSVYQFRDPEDSQSPKYLVGKISKQGEIPDGDDIGKLFGGGLYLRHVQPFDTEGRKLHDFWLPLLRVSPAYDRYLERPEVQEIASFGAAATSAPPSSIPGLSMMRECLQILKGLAEINQLQNAGADGGATLGLIKAMGDSTKLVMSFQNTLLSNVLSSGANLPGARSADIPTAAGSAFPSFDKFLPMVTRALGLPDGAGIMEIISFLGSLAGGNGAGASDTPDRGE